jgi:hypothetical protein
MASKALKAVSSRSSRKVASHSAHDRIIVFCGDLMEPEVEIFPSAEYTKAYRDGFNEGARHQGDWKAFTLDDLLAAAAKGGGK